MLLQLNFICTSIDYDHLKVTLISAYIVLILQPVANQNLRFWLNADAVFICNLFGLAAFYSPWNNALLTLFLLWLPWYSRTRLWTFYIPFSLWPVLFYWFTGEMFTPFWKPP
jgi:hypothetical protein